MKIDKRVVVVSVLLSFAVALPLAHRLVPEAAAKGSHSHGSGYQCPMHPSVVQEREGSCPICGMKLVAMKPQAPTGSGSIPVAPDKQGTLGIAVGTVARSASTRTLRVPGRVVPDEARLYRINSGVEGSFRDVAADATTGSRVRKNQLLGSFYAPATINTLQVFLLNTAGRDRAAVEKKKGGLDGENITLLDANLQQRRIQFENLGISKKQRDEMWRTRKVPDTLQVVSPTDGFILARNASPGLKFERGMELFRVADLSRVWVIADVFPQDRGLLRSGTQAQVVLDDGTALPAAVTEVLPQFDPASRTLKVRVEVDNPDFVLRPDMFVDVQFVVPLPESLTVPLDAVVDAGVTKTVFVETAPGVFEPRKVQTGFRNGDRVQIVGGLSEGEKIATSGVFFLDSETRMKAPLSGAIASRNFAPAPTGHERMSSGGAGEPQPAQEAAAKHAGEHR
ncbi:MAG: efflux RND transporter periplasmic adaptor subunit [Myxococcales bacterium]